MASLKVPHNRLVCAWLSALAAEVPQSRCTESTRPLLANREATLLPTAWGVEVEQWPARLRRDIDFDRGALAGIDGIRRMFLAHFGEAGPAIR